MASEHQQIFEMTRAKTHRQKLLPAQPAARLRFSNGSRGLGASAPASATSAASTSVAELSDEGGTSERITAAGAEVRKGRGAGELGSLVFDERGAASGTGTASSRVFGPKRGEDPALKRPVVTEHSGTAPEAGELGVARAGPLRRCLRGVSETEAQTTEEEAVTRGGGDCASLALRRILLETGDTASASMGSRFDGTQEASAVHTFGERGSLDFTRTRRGVNAPTASGAACPSARRLPGDTCEAGAGKPAVEAATSPREGSHCGKVATPSARVYTSRYTSRGFSCATSWCKRQTVRLSL